jgi:hypothetical protein
LFADYSRHQTGYDVWSLVHAAAVNVRSQSVSVFEVTINVMMTFS